MKVKIIEINEERCEFLSEKLPRALIINGDVSDQYVLYEEGLETCDAFVTLTSIDEENIVCSMFAAMNNVPKIITKINIIKYYTFLQNFLALIISGIFSIYLMALPSRIGNSGPFT